MPAKKSAAIVTVGTELVTGQRLDTNGAEIASALLVAGYKVAEMLSVADDVDSLAAHLERACAAYSLVIVTGGLGPTHDDITRQAAAQALRRPLIRDPLIESSLGEVVRRHRVSAAAGQVLSQADVISAARVIPATSGTAPGQIADTPAGRLLLLPGPPSEMRPMLAGFLGDSPGRAEPRRLRTTGLAESDVQLTAQRAIDGTPGIGLTVLAAPSDVEAVLFDEGAGESELSTVAERVAAALGAFCYSSDGASMAEVVLRLTAQRGWTIASAESCTGGKVSSAMTDVPGSSAVFLGGVVAYSNPLKESLLGVPGALIRAHGAVSEEVARAMAEGATRASGATLAVSTTGIAGPDGGTAGKPVGLVWFGVHGPSGTSAVSRVFPGDRSIVRSRATMFALDLLRRAIQDAE